jgi:hypothetical protein
MTEISKAIKTLLQTVKELHDAYPQKNFTLDGRLLGDIGEVLVEGAYDLKLFGGLAKHHDAETSDKRLVQIKATMQKSLTFPGDHVPDYYLGILINDDGTFDEIFNGTGSIVEQLVRSRAHPKTNLHSVPISTLKKLNETVPQAQKIPRRSQPK